MEIEGDSRFLVNQQKPNEICVPWYCYYMPKNGVSKETLVQMKRLFNTPPPLTSTTLCLIFLYLFLSAQTSTIISTFLYKIFLLPMGIYSTHPT
ncbi:hypothetical protein Hanom_Chr17g01567851 [Helianthus anomalus]